MQIFKVADKVLTEKQQKLCAEAHAEMPPKKTIYKVGNQERVFQFMRQPFGAITPDTQFSSDGQRYATPGASASADEPVIFYEENGESKRCPYSEWKEWHKGNFETAEPPKPPEDPALTARLEAIKRSTNKKDSDDAEDQKLEAAREEGRKSGRRSKK